MKTKYIIVVCLVLLIFSLLTFPKILTYENMHIFGNYAEIDMPSNTPDGKPEPSGEDLSQIREKGTHLYINLDNCTMYIYKDRVLVKTYFVSGGKPSTPSPLGTWKIISKDTWGEGFGGAWLGFNVPWGKYGIHGTICPWDIGKRNASKGCIRMINKEVRELYKFVPHGSMVTIVHNNNVFRKMKSGDIGSDVFAVQKALKDQGYFSNWCDGKFGGALISSVKKFQKQNNLPATGVVNKTTYDLIMSHEIN